MLFLTNVTSWIGVGRESHVIDKRTGTYYVFNINNVSNLKPEGSGSQFLYLTNTINRKSGFDEIHCATPYLTIKEDFNVQPTSLALEISVFPDNNTGKPTFITYINIKDISYAWAHNPHPEYSWLIYNVKSKGARRILINMTLNSLVSRDNQFDENNVQWFYYVNPVEEIDPAKYIRV